MRLLLFYMGLVCTSLVANDSVGVVVIQCEDIYQELSSNNAAIAPDGSLYISNRRDPMIIRFNAKGERLPELGRGGKGPGEFSDNPRRLVFRGDRLYAVGWEKVVVFDDRGKHINDLTRSLFSNHLAKIKGAWVFSDSSFHPQAGVSGKVYLSSEDLQSNQLIVEWPRNALLNKLRARKSGDMVTVSFNPAYENVHLVESLDGQCAWLAVPLSDNLEIITGDGITHTVPLRRNKLEFNELWGEDQLERANKNKRSYVKYIVQFPEYFPAVRQMMAAPRNRVFVEPWSKSPDKDRSLLVFDDQGKQHKTNLTGADLEKILAINNSFALVQDWNREEEKGRLLRTPLNQLEKLLAGLKNR